MLSPETSLFPSPKVKRHVQPNATQADVQKTLQSQAYYNNVIIVFPDEYSFPDFVLDSISSDSEFYKLNCKASELVNEDFVQYFIQNGCTSCLSVNGTADLNNCLAICDNHYLILHVIDEVYQELGIDGKKSKNNFYEISIDLKNPKLAYTYGQKIRRSLDKLGNFELLIKWTPHLENVCPSSIAKYFHKRSIPVSQLSTQVKTLTRDLNQVPTLRQDDIDELVEWVGMLAIGGDRTPSESYISTYLEPIEEGDAVAAHAVVLGAKGFFTSNDVIKIYRNIVNYNSSRDELHWSSLNVKTFTDSIHKNNDIIQFQAIDSVCTVFINNLSNIVHKTVGVK